MDGRHQPQLPVLNMSSGFAGQQKAGPKPAFFTSGQIKSDFFRKILVLVHCLLEPESRQSRPGLPAR